MILSKIQVQSLHYLLILPLLLIHCGQSWSQTTALQFYINYVCCQSFKVILCTNQNINRTYMTLNIHYRAGQMRSFQIDSEEVNSCAGQTLFTRLQSLNSLASDHTNHPCCLSQFTESVLMLRSCLNSSKLPDLTTVDFSSITAIQLQKRR